MIFIKMQLTQYREQYLNVDLYTHFCSDEQAQGIFNLLQTLPWNQNQRRQKLIFANPGISYDITFKGKLVRYPTRLWAELPILEIIKTYVEQLTGQTYTVCVVQRYPNGTIGINPHRDKEMKPGTTILGVSFQSDLTETRNMTFEYKGNKVTVPLTAGSVYVLHPPTNDYWSHSIEKDNTVGVRMSLTFRNY